MHSSKMQQPFSGSIPFPVIFPALAGRVFRPVILPAESFRSRPPGCCASPLCRKYGGGRPEGNSPGFFRRTGEDAGSAE
jgi:hypothetical protein